MSKPKTIYAGRLGHRISLSPDGVITMKGRPHPVAGATASVSDFASGILGSKKTITLTITLGSGGTLLWEQIDTGTAARRTHSEATRLAAAINTMGRRPVS